MLHRGDRLARLEVLILHHVTRPIDAPMGNAILLQQFLHRNQRVLAGEVSHPLIQFSLVLTLRGDFIIIQGVVIVVAVFVIVINAMVDSGYRIVDPRIR